MHTSILGNDEANMKVTCKKKPPGINREERMLLYIAFY